MENSTENSPNISTITLSRGDAGLGFNIRGGVDNPHIPGDTGVFVTKVRENGAAFSDGRLKEGDKILSINGKSLVGVTHEDAVQCFTKAKDTVVLQVEHGAQAAILEKKRAAEKAAENKANEQNKSSSATKYVILVGVIGLAAVGFFVFKRVRSPVSYR